MPVTPPPVAESFQETAKRIAAIPVTTVAKVTKIQVDFSPTAILARLEELSQSAQQRGDITAAAHQEISTAIATLKTALTKIDETKILRGVAVAAPALAIR